MRILMLYTPGRETPVTLPKLREMGYEVELVDGRVSQGCLTNKRKVKSYGKYNIGTIVDPLRAAWISMLRRFKNADKYTLFCESDAYPHVSAKKMKQWIDSIPGDAAVVRLIRYANRKIYKENIDNEVSSEDVDPDFVHMPNRLDHHEIWGTHALWVAPGNREALADVFADYRLPVDVALGYICWAKLPLPIYSTNCPLFSQHPYGTRNGVTPTSLLVCMWIDATVTSLEATVKHVFSMLPATSYFVITTPTKALQSKLTDVCQQLNVNTNWKVQRRDVTWDCDTSLGLLKPDDIDDKEYPMTCVLSQHVEYPLIYLREISNCYKTIPYDCSCFGLNLQSGQKSLCGTLVVRTSKLDEIKYIKAVDLAQDLAHYDLSSWRDMLVLKSSSSNLMQLKDIGTGTDIEISGNAYRRYDDVLINEENGFMGCVQNEEEGKSLEIMWEDSDEVKVYSVED